MTATLLSPSALAEIRERAERATGGLTWKRKHASDWYVDRDDGGVAFVGIGPVQGDDVCAMAVTPYPGDENLSDIADFIVAAPTDIPTLLADRAALEKIIEAQAALMREAANLLVAHCVYHTDTKGETSFCDLCDSHNTSELTHSPNCIITKLRAAGE